MHASLSKFYSGNIKGKEAFFTLPLIVSFYFNGLFIGWV